MVEPLFVLPELARSREELVADAQRAAALTGCDACSRRNRRARNATRGM